MSKKGMRLVAMIEKKENGQYDVVNFLPDITIKHITGKEFEVIEKGDHIQIPYAQGINDLTVIVGENGVGKTRLVNDIFSLDENKMFVFKNLDKIDPTYKGRHTYYNFHILNGSSKVNNKWGLKIKSVLFTNDDYKNEFLPARYFEKAQIFGQEVYIDWFTRKVAIVKLSNTMESSSPKGMGVNLSTTRLLKDNNYNSLLLSDMDKQIKFLLSDRHDSEKLEEFLKFSGKTLKLRFNHQFISDLLNKEMYSVIDKHYLRVLVELGNPPFIRIDQIISYYLVDYLARIYSVIMSPKNHNDSNDSIDYLRLYRALPSLLVEEKEEVALFLNQKIKEAEIAGESINEYVRDELENKRNYYVKKAGYKHQFYASTPKKMLDTLKSEVTQTSEQVISQLDKLFNISQGRVRSFFDLESHVFNELYTINTDEEGCKNKYSIRGGEKIEELLNLQLEVERNENCLVIESQSNLKFSFLRDIIQAISFQWQGLSSGQLALLNLFGRLHSLAEEVKDKESILLLLDEVDLGLHPEWQRKWISTALPIIGEIFKGKHVQIILTTHSPIMLSDIYGENVLMLRKDPETGEQQVVYGGEVTSTSFGQNIHQLFKESFFLEQTKGDYSLKIINATIKAVYDLNQEGADEAAIKADFASELGVGGLSDGQFRAYLEKVIGAIGEKVIAQKLQDMYQTIPLWSQASSLEGKRAGDLSTEELRQLLRQREEAGQ